MTAGCSLNLPCGLERHTGRRECTDGALRVPDVPRPCNVAIPTQGMTKGGPLDSTKSVTFFTYEQFGFGNYAYASAAAYLLFLAIVLLTMAQFRLLREKD